MESKQYNEVGDGDVPLSLISKLCDSALKGLSTSSYPSNNRCETSLHNQNDLPRSPIYSDVLNSSSSSSKIFGRAENEHSFTYSNCADFGDIEAQQLQIEREIALSKHIKPFLVTDYSGVIDKPLPCPIDEVYEIDITDDDQVSHTNSSNCKLINKRLESYLPILKYRIQNGEWCSLTELPSLDSVIGSKNKKPNLDINPAFGKVDKEQGFCISATNELMVFYGVIDKPVAIQPHRLKNLFDYIGIASLPLQSTTTRRKQLYLTDRTGRIRLDDLSGKLQYGKIVSGIPVAIIGKVSGISLLAEDVIFATPCSPEWPIARMDNIEMVFVSGLFLGNEEGSVTCVDLLQDYLLGLSGSAFEQKNILASRARVFFVGNLISKSVKKKSSDVDHVSAVCTKNAEKLDSFLEPLLRVMEVFIIPGEKDITLTSTLPQRPLHPKLLVESTKFSTLKRLPNPAQIQISISPVSSNSPTHNSHSECSLLESSMAEFLKEDVQFIDVVLQSGKNIKSAMNYCDISCPVEMGKRLLEWGHLHPTSEDEESLAHDIFSLKGSLPHLMVIGNISEFKCIEWNGTKIIGVPSFQKTSTAVVLTRDFDVIPISFKLT